MWKFSAILSLILIIAKIFSLITLGWWVCLAPVIVVTIIKLLVLIAIFLIAFFAALKEG